MKTTAKAPYKELDRNIVKLVKALNSFDGIRTVGSCGGHPNPKPHQNPEGSWLITFRVDHSEDGWFALEFITWLMNSNMPRNGHSVQLTPNSAPPYLNEPGATMYFALEGKDVDPDWLAGELRKTKKAVYYAPSQMDKFYLDIEKFYEELASHVA